MISVIIPLYNVEGYVIDCLNSFEKQNYENFELVIVDDGSTDKSRMLVEEYALISDLRIRLVNQQNSGVSVARNRGIKEAKGKYICFVDSDDMVEPEYLSEMIYLLKKKECDLVFCGMKIIKDDIRYENLVFENKNNKFKSSIQEMDSFSALKKFLYNELVSGVGSFLVKKSVIDKYNLFFREGYKYSEDLEFIWRLLNHSDKIVTTNTKLYIYRMRNNSAMSLVDERRLDGFNLIKELEEYFGKNRPEFSYEFRKFAVAKWVWSTTWQLAVSSGSFREFKSKTEGFNSYTYMKKLKKYPIKKIRFSSSLFMISPFLYYVLLKNVVVKKNEIRKMNI